VEHLQNAVVALVDHYGYLGLFVGLVLGNIGFPVAAEVLVPIAAALLTRGHVAYLPVVILVAVAGELVGGTLGYVIGRFGGRAAAERYGRYVGFHHERLDAVTAFFERYGTFAVFLCRFIPMIRGLSPFVAGIAEMKLAPFYLWTLLGSGIFCAGLAFLGNALGAHVHEVIPVLRHWAYVMLALAVLVVIVLVAATRARGGRVAPPNA
jgi:membrane protein DedA with SNARE-associated domain